MAAGSHTLAENLAEASDVMARFAAAPLEHLINGESVGSASGQTFTNESPIDGSHLGDVAAGSAVEIDQAARAADAAFADWSSRTLSLIHISEPTRPY